MSKKKFTFPNFEICILAGGLSSRIGRDKSRLRLGRRTMLAHVRAAARQTGFPVRVIRRDLVQRCGPLGGIFTALKTTRADTVLLLACDMPFVSAGLLKYLLGKFNLNQSALFTQANQQAGFPFLIARNKLCVVENQIARKEFSIRKITLTLHAGKIKLPPRFAGQLQNINTPADLERARRLIAKK